MSHQVLPYLQKFSHWCLNRATRFGKEISLHGLAYFPYRGESECDLLQVIDAPESLLRQLQELRRKGLCSFNSKKFELSWAQVYAVIEGGDPVLMGQLHLDAVESVQLSIASTGRIGCDSFNVRVALPSSPRSGVPLFITINGRPVPAAPTGRVLSADNFRLMAAIAEFQAKSLVDRISEGGAAAWGHIVHLAQVAGADVEQLTTQRTTLNLEKLRLVLSAKVHSPGVTKLELMPYFSGSPPTWRDTFVASNEVPACYDVPGRAGRTQVDICPEVAPLVFEAKRMLGRRVGGAVEVIRYLQVIDQADLEDMSPEAFEQVCALIYRKQGYPASFRVGGSGDGGVDVVALRGMQGLLLQCKSSKELDKRLGWEGVKDVVAGEAGYRNQHPGVQFQKLALTNQYFNATAKEQARLNNVQLMDKLAIMAEIKRLHISYFELRHFSKGAV